MESQMVFGDLVLTFTDQYTARWKDKGSGADKDVAFWHPKAPAGFFPLGSIGVGNYSGVDGKYASICVKAIEGSPDAVAHPTGYTNIWKDKGSGANQDGSCWRPTPPEGYVAMGDVFVRGYNKPSLDDVVCIRKDLAYQAKAGKRIWKDKGSGADKDFDSYQIDVSEHYIDSEKGLFAPNTFVGNNRHSKPTGAPVLFCLNLPFPVIEAADPAAPQLTSVNPPPAQTGMTIDRTVLVPFTAIEDDSKSVSWKVDNSPFYRLERQISYKVELFDYNRGTTEQTIKESIKVGVSKTKSEEFSVKTGISVTTEAGVSFLGSGGKVSATVSTELGWRSSTSITEFEERTIEKPVRVPGETAVAVWATSYQLMIRRGDDSLLSQNIAFEVDYFVHDEYKQEALAPQGV